jgi:5-(carboxyamino)imidazole ribonucleotide mutase
MKVLLLFGSTSDESVYNPLKEALDKEHQVRLEVLSAHRNTRELDQVLQDSEDDVIWAGAGLAAHLPGIVSSKTLKPVLGLPVEAHFGGLDATLAIVQMSFGIPVITMGPGMASEGIEFLTQMRAWLTTHGRGKKAFNLIVNPKIQAYEYVSFEIKRALEFAVETQLDLTVTDQFDPARLNIRMVVDPDDIMTNKPVIHVPVFDKVSLANPSRALRLFEWVRMGGLWVGVNNTRNAFLGYLRFLS